jgi:hypothetical protein
VDHCFCRFAPNLAVEHFFGLNLPAPVADSSGYPALAVSLPVQNVASLQTLAVEHFFGLNLPAPVADSSGYPALAVIYLFKMSLRSKPWP